MDSYLVTEVCRGDRTENQITTNNRSLVKRMGRERLLRYVHDIIQKNTKPLHEIVRDHALRYLPAQSLLRFRSVSTSWNHLISSPFFAHTNSQSHHSLSGLFFHTQLQLYNPPSYLPFHPTNSHSLPDPSLTFLPVPVVVAASSNGLVCCVTRTGARMRATHYVCNPATTQWAALPKPASYGGSTALVFRPSALNFSADYHLICASKIQERCTFKVFSSKEETWRDSDQVALVGSPLSPGPGVSAGGSAHWPTTGGAVVSYDPTADRCRVLESPGKGSRWRLGEIGGRLCCVVCSAEEGTVGIFILKEGERWARLRFFEVTGDAWPLACEGGTQEVVLWLDGRVLGVHVASGRRRELCDSVSRDCSEFVPYISSLVSVKQF